MLSSETLFSLPNSARQDKEGVLERKEERGYKQEDDTDLNRRERKGCYIY